MRSERRCTATTRRGQPCGAWAMVGALVCRMHGGSATQVKRKAAERVAVAGARSILASHQVVAVTDPVTALSELAGEVMAFKDLLSERAGELGDLVLTDQAGHEEVRATLVAYERALDRCGRLLVAMARLNLDERLVKMDEAMLALLAETMLRILASPALALTPSQVIEARSRIAAELRALEPSANNQRSADA